MLMVLICWVGDEPPDPLHDILHWARLTVAAAQKVEARLQQPLHIGLQPHSSSPPSRHLLLMHVASALLGERPNTVYNGLQRLGSRTYPRRWQ